MDLLTEVCYIYSGMICSIAELERLQGNRLLLTGAVKLSFVSNHPSWEFHSLFHVNIAAQCSVGTATMDTFVFWHLLSIRCAMQEGHLLVYGYWLKCIEKTKILAAT